MTVVVKVWGFNKNRLAFFCPGCKEQQSITVNSDTAGRPVWNWNGSLEQPTITPSILTRGTWPLTDEEAAECLKGNNVSRKRVCHSFITDGKIQFLNDCTHSLAGQTVDLPEWPKDLT